MKPSLWRAVRHELMPFPGRLATAWRLGLICSLTALAFMTWQIPLVAIGCYLVLFVMKPDPGESTLMAIAICILVSIIVALLVWLTRISINIPTLRLIILAASSFFFLYLGSASKLGPVGSIIALVIAFIMTLLGSAPVGEVATRGLLYAWLMALIPMGLLLISQAVFGQSVPRLLRAQLARRLSLIDQIRAGDLPSSAVWPALRTGNNPISSYLKFIAVFHLLPNAETLRLKTQHERTLHMLLLLARRAELEQNLQMPMTEASRALESALENCRHTLDIPLPEGPKNTPSGFFREDALTNPAHYRYALKTTLAACLAYIVYTALDWQDIHTAMVTCYVAALGSTGETLHKLTLRLLGCLIGAAMGIGSILLLMPHMTSIGALMMLVFVGTLIAGWVSSGSERIAYAGVQIGLAFLMTVLQGFGPDVQLSVAIDRIIGILLGNALLYIIFTRIWPVSSLNAAHSALDDIAHRLDRLQANALPDQVLAPSQVAELLSDLHLANEQILMHRFERGHLQEDRQQMTELRQRIKAIEMRCIRAALEPVTQTDKMRRYSTPADRVAICTSFND